MDSAPIISPAATNSSSSNSSSRSRIGTDASQTAAAPATGSRSRGGSRLDMKTHVWQTHCPPA
jgi:hypothetical protein